MTPPPVVSNSSPLIALEQIGQLNLLERLFVSVIVAPAVAHDTASTVVLPAWITGQALTQSIGPQILRASLGPGESEAISLALEIGAAWVILDDRPARRLAQGLGLPVVGTLVVLVASKRRGFLSAVKPCLDALIHQGFFVAAALYQGILTSVGESP
jgi:predicted nucleic acid-binding protein